MIKLTLDTTLQKLNISRYELAKRTGIQYQIIDNYYKNRVKRYDSDVLRQNMHGARMRNRGHNRIQQIKTRSRYFRLRAFFISSLRYDRYIRASLTPRLSLCVSCIFSAPRCLSLSLSCRRSVPSRRKRGLILCRLSSARGGV